MKYQSAQTHIAAILAALASGKDELLMDNAAIDVERANLWKTMGKLEQMIHISKALDAEARGQGERARRDRAGQGQGDPRDRALLHPPAHHRPAHPDGGDGAGLSRARPGQEEQCRAGEGRRPRLDHHRLGAAHRGHRRPGADQPEAGARADHRAQHHHRQHDRIDRRAAEDPDRPRSTSRRPRRRSRWRRCSAPSRTSTTRWTRSTASRSRRSAT